MIMKARILGLLAVSLSFGVPSVEEPDLSSTVDRAPIDNALCAENWTFRLNGVNLTPETLLSVTGEICNRSSRPVGVFVSTVEGQLGLATRIWAKGMDGSYRIEPVGSLHINRPLEPKVLKPGDTLPLEWHAPLESPDNSESSPEPSYCYMWVRSKPKPTDKDSVKPVILQPGEYVVDAIIHVTLFDDPMAFKELGIVTLPSDNKLWVEVASTSSGKP
jgi:hypothetical protein